MNNPAVPECPPDQYKLTKISSNHERVRTNEIVGHVVNWPRLGKMFHMIARPLDQRADFRWLNTTRIKKIEFWTENSHYRLEACDDSDPGAPSGG